jgi:16S rRNA (adenine(1408)-N(1))-methyltransferase
VLHAARSDPDLLSIGVDANAESMGWAAHRAADRRRGVANAMFVVATAESLPCELTGIADLVTVHFPWSSLLRGIVTGEGPVLRNLAALCRPDGELRAIWSLTDRDGVPSGDPAAIGAAFAAAGLRITEHRPATRDEIAATGSSWAKRLRAGVDRPVTLVRARVCARPPSRRYD